MEIETNNLVIAWENFSRALFELVERFREIIIAAVKKALAVVKEIKEALTVWEYEDWKEPSMMEYWQEQQQLHQHQVINRMKVQEKTMRSYQQPWKAWKAQRR